ncbi:hypothetical protein D0469_11355 [Peribacillus saganii]|uniref:YtzH-like protein n=1 Tax=Peribacillus saganii TaxID=2303992 RepID=A0A372LNC3_9BACI|nr:YtzH-like family protein [Peribacillus saganii]RFU68727.1 hypothetical protein D0469_11355 [Peribacillus saganii]
MPLSEKNQAELLKDILNNHQSDCCGSVAECEQVERIVKSLMVNSSVKENVKAVLQEIYSYSQNGINSSDLDQYITSHQGQLSQWVDEIDKFS